MARGQIIFRVNAARKPGLSYGHLFRCLALAKFIRTLLPHEICFWLEGEEQALQVVKDNGFKANLIREPLGKGHWEKQRLKLIIFDLLEIPSTYNALPCPKVAIDDRGGKDLEVDLITNSSLVRNNLDYPFQEKTVYLLGPEYFILGPEFLLAHPTPIRPDIQNVLITMGGSDPLDLTQKIAQQLLSDRHNYKITFVLGPGSRAKEHLDNMLATYPSHCQLVEHPPDLASIMAQADLVIMAGGRTPYEAAFLGRPGICIPSSPAEAKTTRVFAQRKIFLTIDQGWKLNQKQLTRQLHSLLETITRDYPLRWKMHQLGQKTIDGQGGARVAKAIVKLLE